MIIMIKHLRSPQLIVKKLYANLLLAIILTVSISATAHPYLNQNFSQSRFIDQRTDKSNPVNWIDYVLFGSEKELSFTFYKEQNNGFYKQNTCIVELPYTEDFSSSNTDLPLCTSVIDVNSDMKTWMVTTSNQSEFTPPFLRYLFSSTNDANDWFFTKGFVLKAGINYNLRYKTSGYGNDDAEKLKVMIGSSNTVEAMTITLKDYPKLTSKVVHEDFVFNVAKDGVYYIGFHAYSPKDRFMINLDDIRVSLPSPCDEPLAPFTQIPQTNTAEISWTAPANPSSLGYEYFYSTNLNKPLENEEKTISTTKTTVQIDQLSKNTTYTWWVRSVCSATTKTDWLKGGTFTTYLPKNDIGFLDDFEGENHWIFVNGTQKNQWVIGSATQNGGKKSMYISSDGGSKNTYTNTNSRTYAYTDFNLPATVKKAFLSFDWKSLGDKNAKDLLKLWIVPTNFQPVAGNAITESSNRVKLAEFGLVNTYSTHQINNLDLSKYTGSFRIVFEWTNDDINTVNPPASIDNFLLRTQCDAQITEVNHTTVYSGLNATVTVKASPGVKTYKWYNAAIGGQLLATTTTPSYTLKNVLKDTKIFVTATDDDCESDERTLINITIEKPVTPIILKTDKNKISACNNDFATIRATGGEQYRAIKAFYFDTKEETSQWLITNGDETMTWNYGKSMKAGGRNQGELVLSSVQTTSETTQKTWSVKSRAIDLKNKTKDLAISFTHTLDIKTSSISAGSLVIEASEDNGNTWKTIWTNQVLNSPLKESEVNVKLTTLEKADQLEFRFSLKGNSQTIANWYLDDIVLSSTQQPIEWSSHDGLFTDSELLVPYKQGEFATVLYAQPSITTSYVAAVKTLSGVKIDASINLQVISTEAPLGETSQSACSTITLADFVVDGQNIRWYASATGGEELPATTLITGGVTYYASQTVNNCESKTRLSIKANSCLESDELTHTKLSYYPNPVDDFLIITGKELVHSYQVFSVFGQQLATKTVDQSSAKIDLRSLKKGVYFVMVVFSSGHSKTIQVIKK